MAQLAKEHAEMSRQAQDAIDRLASLGEQLGDQAVRAEVRRFLGRCADAQVDAADIERARIVLATFDGEFAEHGSPHEGVTVTGIRPR